MRSINCDVIQDLLPSYLDKISSESTNKLVEEHLQSCKNCQDVLQSMSKDIDCKIVENQDEQIDFLKGFRKDKIKSNIKAILIFIVIALVIYLTAFNTLGYIFKNGICINADDINVEYMYMNNNNQLETYLYSEKYKHFRFEKNIEEILNENGKKEIHIKIIGRDLFFNISGCYTSIKIDEDTDKIYLEDKKGNLKEIWNKDADVMTENEWKHWYVDSYIPQELKEKYNINYDNVLKFRGHEDEPFIWRQYYDSYYKDIIN